MTNCLGYREDVPDSNDLTINTFLSQPGHMSVVQSVKSDVDNSKYVVEVLGQQLNDCVANSGYQAIRMSQIRHLESMGFSLNTIMLATPPLGSRLFGYLNARIYSRETQIDGGTFIRDFYRANNELGFLPEYEYPYIADKYAEIPGADIYHKAFDQSKKSIVNVGVDPTYYYRILSVGSERLQAIDAVLDLGYTVQFGTQVTYDYVANRNTQSLIYQPETYSNFAGGHAQLIVGRKWDGNRRHYKILNSWTDKFGIGGYAWYDQSYITWERSVDFWCPKGSPHYS